MTPEQLKSSLLCSCLHGKLLNCYSQTCVKDEIDEKYILKEVEEEPFDIPENWVWVKLGDIISFIGGSQPPKTKFIYEEREGYTRLIQIRDFKSDAYKVYIPTDSTKKFFSSTDIMIGRYGPPIFQILRGLEGAYNVALMKAEPKINIDKDFLYYLLQDPILFNVLVQKSNRCCGQDGIDMATLKEHIVGLPPFEDQRSIVDKIERLLPYVERYAEAYEKLEQFNAKFPEDMKRSILQYAIQGKLVEQRPEEGTAEELYQHIQNEKQKLIKEGKIKKEKPFAEITEGEIPFDIPDNWKWVRVSEIFSILNGDRGKNYPAKSTLRKEGIPFISALNLDSHTVKKDDNLLCLSDEQYERLGNGKLIKGDIVVCIRGSLGKHGRYQFDKGAIASSLVICRQFSNEDILAEYFMLYLDAPLFFALIREYDNGTAQPNLAAKSFEQFLFPLPPLEEQRRIVAKIEELLPYCDRLIK